MRDQDIEEKVEDAIVGVIRYMWYGLLNHGWSIADRLFKITSWTMLVGALKVLSQKTNISSLDLIANVLLVVLFVGVVTTVINVMIYFQDKASENLSFQLPMGWRVFIMLVVNVFLILLGLYVILPAIILSVTEILDALQEG